MSFIPDKIRVTCEKLHRMADTYLYDLSDIEYVKADGYKTGNTPPETGWEPFAPGMRVQGRDAHFWFRVKFKTPKLPKGTDCFVNCTTGFEGQWDADKPQGLIYLNGRMTQGCDANHTEIYLEQDTEYVMHNYFYVGLMDQWVPMEFKLYIRRESTDQLYYDMQTALDVCGLQEPASREYIAMMDVLEQTANLLDFRCEGSEAYLKSEKAASDYINTELYKKLCTTKDKPVVDCVGHTHIDVEWLWTRAQTREKIQRSFSTAEALMEQYPEYHFMLSQPELYRYLKEEAPEKYAELKKRVKEGRWEPEGAMYLEADCNLISGESFVRQIMQGKKFFRDEFGVESHILFLPDVFGYSAAMPQILKKSGVRHFVTSKISWNETNTMPVSSFLWKGIDGSEIFTNFIMTQAYTPNNDDRRTTYVGMLNPSEIKGTWENYKQKEYSDRTFTTYGYGDGGGGPTRKMLETQRRLAKGMPGMPVTRMDSLLEHLDKNREEFDRNCIKTKRTPRWTGELYLEFHRGTYTSMARNKRGNRKSEFMLEAVEALSFADLLSGGSYDAGGIYHNWNLVLHNQFHDIIPGSSIREVYEGTDIDYAQIAEYCTGRLNEKLAAAAARVDTKGGVLVYNPLGFARKGTAQIDGRTVELTDEIPAFGWRVIRDCRSETEVVLDGLTAENKYYKLTLDKAGRIAQLWDKRAQRNVFKEDAAGNELQVFEDCPREYDNWEITDYYKQKMWVLDSDAKIEPAADGCRAGFKITRRYLNSVIVQKIWMYTDCERIDVENEVDWHEHHQLMKAAFPLDIHTDTATYEIQYGHVKRPTYANTSWDAAKFEVYGHKWADLSEDGYGFSLLNDCKYGHNAEDSTLKLTLIKCGTDPNPEADQGMHYFTYSLLPHMGDFREAGVIRAAYELNQPVYTVKTEAHEGTLPEVYSLASCDQENIVMEVVKKAEADDSMILRMYDAFNRRSDATIRVAEGFEKAYLCDLMENPIEELPFDGKEAKVHVGNFEIVTLKFTRK